LYYCCFILVVTEKKKSSVPLGTVDTVEMEEQDKLVAKKVVIDTKENDGGASTQTNQPSQTNQTNQTTETKQN